MFERFGREAQQTVVRALVEARQLDDDAIRAVHLLLALTGSGSLAPALAATLTEQDVTPDRLRDSVADVTAASPPPGTWEDGPYAEDAKQVFELAQREAIDLGHEAVASGHLLLAVLRLDDLATKALEWMGTDVDELTKEVERVVETEPAPDPPPGPRSPLGGRHSLGISYDELEQAATPGDRRSRLICGFCGRDLGASDLFVAGEAAFICDGCVRASSRIIDEMS